MCTASWLIRPDGFELFFNRDEAPTRRAERPPEVATENGVRHLAPTDGEAGGTWIGVNEHGLAVGLLNAYGTERGGAPANATSRGLIVRRLLGCSTPARAEALLRASDLGAFRGFRVLLLAPGGGPFVLVWDRRELAAEPATMPLVSSGLDSARAFEERAAVLAALTGGREPDRDALAAFHASHAPRRGPWSPCMHREDASTVSATHVVVEGTRIRLRHAAGPPCVTAWSEPRALPSRPLGEPSA